ncbi:MAG: TlpA family protein disulfide reductase [Bacteroidetes bacterium]|nr:MAG: TlpA family protein disulfide reductase [Bacteroidota bacterium]
MNLTKTIILNLLLAFSFQLLAQKEIKAKISGNIFNYQGDTMRLSQIVSNRYVDYLKAYPDDKGNYKMQGKLPAADYYVLRAGNAHINLIIRDGSDIQIHGDGSNLRNFNNIVNSDESVKLNEFVQVMQVYNYKKDSANRYLRTHPGEETKVNEAFYPLFYDFMAYRKRFLSENQKSAQLLPMLSVIEPDNEFEVYEEVVENLVAGFGESPSIQNVKAQFEQQKARKEKMSFLEPGKPAPDFQQNKPDGTSMKLSDLKGKVVLLDFWASWCRPCRAENPNVVRLYQRYKDDGFTVMSVSLDRDKERWEAAIAKDGLLWPNHVSDLKQWSNEVARLYQVTGIPFTVLIDQEGKIIQTNLRGAQLAQKLEQLFGH